VKGASLETPTNDNNVRTARLFQGYWSEFDICIRLQHPESKCRNQKDTSNFSILAELLNLTFECGLVASGTEMSNSLHLLRDGALVF
jgi:hypothetical protein